MENGAISVGDALTSSSQPGVAMKATHAGKIIGYAMESANQAGFVRVLIQPGYYLPDAETLSVEQTEGLRGGVNVTFDLNAFALAALLIGAVQIYRARKYNAK